MASSPPASFPCKPAKSEEARLNELASISTWRIEETQTAPSQANLIFLLMMQADDMAQQSQVHAPTPAVWQTVCFRV